MFVVTQLQPITVLFTLPEDNLPAVAQHMKRSPLPVDVYSRDDETKLATGKLLTIDNQIDPTTGTGKLKAVFDNKDNMLWPNQFVNIRLLLEVRKSSTVIPAASIQRGPQGTYVFVVKQDHTVDIRPVTIAFTQQNLSNIAGGISPGEIVVTDGQDKLKAGSSVEPRAQDATDNQGRGARSPSAPGPNDRAPGNSSSTNPTAPQRQSHSGDGPQNTDSSNASSGNSSK
jgi:multidrug efflux system membrane fusion protein